MLPLLVVSLAMPAGASRVATGPNALPLGVRISNFEMHRLAVDWPILNNQHVVGRGRRALLWVLESL